MNSNDTSRRAVRSPRLDAQYTELRHPSGLRMLLCPMEGFSTAYAMLGTPYGSVHTRFRTKGSGDFVTVPEGIAHFLEHKLFENEDCDAFERYAKTGASANAYTSFDRTCYLFECSDNFEQSLEILFDFVTHPYFTQATVDKEQGIIGQEIRMYDDSPDWRVQFGLLSALYHSHPVRVEIAGTVESIGEITADLLYRCYNTFYNLNNMVLAVAGNFTIEAVLRVADRVLSPAEPVRIEYGSYDEPEGIRERYAEQELAVAAPLFNIGFKSTPGDIAGNIRASILDEMLLEIIAGEASPLYRRLYDQSLINQAFYGESMASASYICSMFCGESKDPRRVFDEILAEVRRIGAAGIDPGLFDVAKATIYGRYTGAFDTAEGVCGLLVTGAFGGVPMYDLVEFAASVTPDMLAARLGTGFDVNRAALSVVRPVGRRD